MATSEPPEDHGKLLYYGTQLSDTGLNTKTISSILHRRGISILLQLMSPLMDVQLQARVNESESTDSGVLVVFPISREIMCGIKDLS